MDVERDEKGKYVPGHSGNPNGRPEGSISMVGKLRQYLQDHPEDADKLIRSLILQGTTGNITATKEILDRIDGKVTDKLEVKGELLITASMRALAAREILETKEEETKLLKEGDNGQDSQC